MPTKTICSWGLLLSQVYLQEKDFAEQLRKRLQTISLCERYTDWMLEQVDKWKKEESKDSQSEIQNLTEKIKASETRLERLIESYLYGDIPKEIYLKQKDKIMRATIALKEKMKDFEKGRNK